MREKVLVVGSGVSGIAACELLKSENVSFTLYDQNEDLDIAALREKSDVLADADIIAGELSDEAMSAYKEAVLSPGVPLDKPLVKRLEAAGVAISGEIELAYRYSKGRLCAITGTNGKTTTTSLVGELIGRVCDETYVVGNIGIPYTSVASRTTDESICVAEISSFQLETADTFKPDVAAILNITPDHLDRHHTMDAYAAAKQSITANMSDEGVVVLNYEDERLRAFADTLSARVVFFSSGRVLEDGVYLDGDDICFAENGSAEAWLKTTDLKILGKHNHENAMAAMAMAYHMGVGKEDIIQGLKDFVAVEHRIEYVCEKGGVRFYNDSKGTNPDAAIKAVLAMDRPICLIGGGYDKSASYDEWVETFPGRVKKLILMGETSQKIAECAESHGFTDYEMAASLQEAVQKAYEAAESGDAVLLSPACASWDMFKNYEIRGRQFKEFANSLS